MSIFATNFRDRIKDYLPPAVRGSSVIDWLYSLAKPVESKIVGEAVYIAVLDEELKYNGQKIVLQAALNNLTGATGIIVVTNRTFNGLAPVLYNAIESINTGVTKNKIEGGDTMVTINTSEETNAKDFQVQIPVGIHTADLEAEVDHYTNLMKPSGTTYEIITI